MKYWLIFWLSTISLVGTLAQSRNASDLTQKYLEEAKALNASGDYDAANIKFRQILALNEVIPAEMCYHFAETLYAIGQFQNSKNFVSKYFELTGTTGENYREVKKLEEMVDAKLDVIRACHRCNTVGYRYKPCQTCSQTGVVEERCYYCQGHGIAVCTKCKGNGVLISANALGGSDYRTCDRCEGNGKEICPTCNGDKTLKSDCPSCNGFFFETSAEICDHQDHPEDGFVVPNVFEKSGN